MKDRPTTNPGGIECLGCGCIFIGDESYAYCGDCDPMTKHTHAERPSDASLAELNELICWSRGRHPPLIQPGYEAAVVAKVRELDAAKPAQDSSIALATEWLRDHVTPSSARERAYMDTIIEALAAYDPERVGARTVAKPAQEAACAICEGTGLANVVDPDDGALVVDDCPECGGESAAQAPERRAVTDEDVRRALDAFNGAWRHSPDYILDPSSNAFGMHQMRAALESLKGVPAAQPAPDAGEPVAWRYRLNAEKPERWAVVQQWPLQFDGYEDREKWTIEPLYTHPASAASEADSSQQAALDARDAARYRELMRGSVWMFTSGAEGDRLTIRYDTPIKSVRTSDPTDNDDPGEMLDAALAAQQRKGW